jgi:hypothetical protein
MEFKIKHKQKSEQTQAIYVGNLLVLNLLVLNLLHPHRSQKVANGK